MKFAVHVMLPKRRPPNVEAVRSTQHGQSSDDDRKLAPKALESVAVPIEPSETFADLWKIAETRFRDAYGHDKLAGLEFDHLQDLQGADICAEDTIGSMYTEAMPTAELQLFFYLEEIGRESTIPPDSALRPKGCKRKVWVDLDEAEQASAKKRRLEEARFGSAIDDLHPDTPVLSREVVNDSDTVAGADQDSEPVRIDADGFKIPSKAIKTRRKPRTGAVGRSPIVLVNRSQSETDSPHQRSSEDLPSKVARTVSSASALRQQKQSANVKGTPNASGDRDPCLSETPPTAGGNDIDLQQTPPSGQRTQDTQSCSSGQSHDDSIYEDDTVEDDRAQEELEIDDIADTPAGDISSVSRPTAFQQLPSSQSSSGIVCRKTSSNPKWTKEEDKILLTGIQNGWNSDQISRALPRNTHRTQSGIRGRRILLKKRFPAGLSNSPGEKTAPSSSGRQRWAESEIIVLRRAIAAGLDPLEIREQRFPRRSIESVSHRYRSLLDTVLHNERKKPSFPKSKIRTPNWTDQDNLKLRRMHIQRIPIDRSHALWFSGWPKATVAKKYKEYKEQLRKLPISRSEFDLGTNASSHSDTEVAELEDASSTAGVDSLPQSSNTANTPDLPNSSAPLSTQAAGMSSPCRDAADRHEQDERQAGQLRRVPGSGGQTALNFHRDKGKKAAHGNRVDPAQVDQLFGKSQADARSSTSQPATDISSDEDTSGHSEQPVEHDTDEYRSSSPCEEMSQSEDNGDEPRHATPTGAVPNVTTRGIASRDRDESPALAQDARPSSCVWVERSPRDSAGRFARQQDRVGLNNPIPSTELIEDDAREDTSAAVDEHSTLSSENLPQGVRIAYVQLQSPRQVKSAATKPGQRSRTASQRASVDIASSHTSGEIVDNSSTPPSFLGRGAHVIDATDQLSDGEQLSHDGSHSKATSSVPASVSSRNSSGKLRPPTRAPSNASRLFGARQSSRLATSREMSPVRGEDRTTTVDSPGRAVKDTCGEPELNEETFVDGSEALFDHKGTDIPTEVEDHIEGVVYDDGKMRVTLPSPRGSTSGLFKDRTNAERWKMAHEGAGGDVEKARMRFKMILNREHMLNAMMRDNPDEISRLNAQRRRLRRERTGSSPSTVPRRNDPLTGLNFIRSTSNEQQADEEVIRDDDWTTADEEEREDDSDDAFGEDDGIQDIDAEESEDEYDGMDVVDLGGKVVDEIVDEHPTSAPPTPPVALQTPTEVIEDTIMSDRRRVSAADNDASDAAEEVPSEAPVASAVNSPDISARSTPAQRDSLSHSLHSGSFSHATSTTTSVRMSRESKHRRKVKPRRNSSISGTSSTPKPRPAGVSKQMSKRERRYENQRGYRRSSGESGATKPPEESKSARDVARGTVNAAAERLEPAWSDIQRNTTNNDHISGSASRKPARPVVPPANITSSTSGHSDAHSVAETSAISAAPLSPQRKHDRQPTYIPPPKFRAATPTADEVRAKFKKQACPYPSSDEDSTSSSSEDV